MNNRSNITPPRKPSDTNGFWNYIKKGFTLAEVISVITILGVVAAITIPATIKRTTDRANKTKIKKALSAYNTAVEKMIVENNLPRSQRGLTDYIGANCQSAGNYFKMAQMDPVAPVGTCRFKAPDGLWWDVSDITNTIVAFENENKSEHNPAKYLNWVTAGSKDFKAFKFVTRFDNNGTVRINDNSYSVGATDYAIGIAYNEANKKIQAYFNNEKYLENILAKYSRPCFDETKPYRCTTANQACRGCTSNWDRGDQYATGDYWGQYLSHVYDEKGKEVAYMWHCQPGTNECSSVSTNGIYVEREDGLFIECYNCDRTFTKPAGDTFVQLQKREGDKVTCSCTGCEFARYRNDAGKRTDECTAARTCVSCKGDGCPAKTDDGCYHL